MASSAVSTASLKGPVSGQAGVVSIRVIETVSPSNLEVAHHVQGDDVAVQLRVFDPGERLHDGAFADASGIQEQSFLGAGSVRARRCNGSTATRPLMHDLVADRPLQQLGEQAHVPLAAARSAGQSLAKTQL